MLEQGENFLEFWMFASGWTAVRIVIVLVLDGGIGKRVMWLVFGFLWITFVEVFELTPFRTMPLRNTPMISPLEFNALNEQFSGMHDNDHFSNSLHSPRSRYVLSGSSWSEKWKLDSCYFRYVWVLYSNLKLRRCYFRVNFWFIACGEYFYGFCLLVACHNESRNTRKHVKKLIRNTKH